MSALYLHPSLILANIKSIESCSPHFKQFKILTLLSVCIPETCKFVKQHPDTNVDDLPQRHIFGPRNILFLPKYLLLHMHSTSVGKDIQPVPFQY